MRIDTQKQTLTARDESIKKLLEMLQNKGEGINLFIFSNSNPNFSFFFFVKINWFSSAGKEEEARVHQHMQMVAQKQVHMIQSKELDLMNGRSETGLYGIFLLLMYGTVGECFVKYS